MKNKVIGSFEPISFPFFPKVEGVMAKIDTGAYSGALHCTRLWVDETESGKVLHFLPFDHPEEEVSISNFAVRYVRSSNGDAQSRYFIETEIVIRGNNYPVVLSLADRGGMRYPVLIGRRFLRANNFVVDVNHKSSVL